MKYKSNSIIKSALSSPLWGYKRVVVLLLLAIIFTFTTCKRYPEGGWSNVAIKHLFGGHKKGSSKTWHLKKYEVNGIDSTMYITSGNSYTSFENDEVIFMISVNKEYYAESKIYGHTISFSELNNPKIKKVISFSGGSGVSSTIHYQCKLSVCERMIFNPQLQIPAPYWNIEKLKINEFIISTSILNFKYVLTFTH